MVPTFMGCTTKTALKQFMHLKMSPKSQKAGCLESCSKFAMVRTETKWGGMCNI